jgi:RNA polymerase sigma-70 factor (ECF subfamily)
MPEVVDRRRTQARFEAQLAPVLDSAFGVALNMTRHRDEAEDLVQEAAILAYKAFDQFELGTNFKAWFFRILINRFRNDYRRRKREPEIAPLEDAPELYMNMQSTETGLIKAAQDPAALVIGRMSEDQIMAAVAVLPEEFRVVSALYFIEEMAYQEIADLVGCPVGTVRSRLHRSRKLLQKALWDLAKNQGLLSGVLPD